METSINIIFTDEALAALTLSGLNPAGFQVELPSMYELVQGDLIGHYALGDDNLFEIASRMFSWNSNGDLLVQYLLTLPPSSPAAQGE